MSKEPMDENKKIEQRNTFLRDNNGKEMSSNEGVKISDDSNSLKAGIADPRCLKIF